MFEHLDDSRPVSPHTGLAAVEARAAAIRRRRRLILAGTGAVTLLALLPLALVNNDGSGGRELVTADGARPTTTESSVAFAPADEVQHDDRYPLWPERTSEGARASARNGPAWRRDADETAVRFAHMVLGWQNATVSGEVRFNGAAGRRVTNESSTVVVVLNQWSAGWWSVSGVHGEHDDSFGVMVSGRRFEIGIPNRGQHNGALKVFYGERSVEKDFGPSGETVGVDLPFDPDTPGHALILLRDASGTVIAAYTAGLPPGDFAAG